ncbi:MAG: hypothetical protein KF908_07445 [Nitrosomonas sp.]|nr:hypothetical protein [Nitrosomonas sp.]MCW5607353.1 hypothetical protein [Nitrosomonas sp.]
MIHSRPMEVRLWWPLPLAVLLWLLMIWMFGFFISEPEVDSAISIPDAIEAEFLELPEIPQQESAPAPQQAQIEPAVKIPPKIPPLPPQTRPPVSTTPPSVRKDAIEQAKIQPPKEKTRVDTPQKKDTDAPADLSEYIKRQRGQNPAAGIFDGSGNNKNINPEPQPSADEVRMARVKRNLQMPGTSGIFQITQIGPRYAQFSFRAWTTDVSNPRRELIDVQAGADGDIERAIIRRMIQLIRQYHQEDFNWESHRLNRVIVLSARPRDNEGLENFLMREFFGEPLPPYMR